MEGPKISPPSGVQPEKTLAVMQTEMKAVYDTFAGELTGVKKEYRESLNVILKDIDERKIKDLKEKLKKL